MLSNKFRLLLLTAIFLVSINDVVATKKSKPNIILVLVDDLGKEWISCYGAQDVKTPNIDKLADKGIRFENAYSMPQCTPTRTTILTGQYPYQHGWINHWDVPRWGGGVQFDHTKYPVISKTMKSAGYKTAIAGKWQINDFRVQPNILKEMGFDDYCMWTGYESGIKASAERYWNPYIHTKSGSKTYKGEYGPDIFFSFVSNFIKSNKNSPFFVYYPMVLTHGPYITTPNNTDENRNKKSKFKSMVEYTDKIVGKLVDELKKNNVYDNTLLIFTTDNGTGGVKAYRNGRLIRGAKARTVEAGTSMPYIVSWPEKIKKGRVSYELTDFTDFLPTFAEIGGTKIPKSVNGKSIAKYLQSKSKKTPKKWILSMGGQNRAKLTENGVENEWYFRDRVLRDKEFKVWVGTDKKIIKIFDMINDPYEEINLINSNHKKVLKVLRKFRKIVSKFPDKDNDPQYTPLGPQEWDKKVTHKSQIWKKGKPE